MPPTSTPTFGMTIPLDGVPLDRQAEVAQEIARLGYGEVWSSEGHGTDAFSPLAVVATAAPSLRLGTGIVPVFTRGPACLAQSAAALAGLAPGRFTLGLGTSSQLMSEQWNDVRYQHPYRRIRDMVRFLTKALAGEVVDEQFDTFVVRGFRLGAVPPEPPRIVLAALGEQMLRLAGREADGAIVTWLTPDDVEAIAPLVHAGGTGKSVVVRAWVAPSTEDDAVRAVARQVMGIFLNTPGLRGFHTWRGRAAQLDDVWARWDAGDIGGAFEAVPASLIDELVVHGTPEQCRDRLAQYAASGATNVVAALLPVAGLDPLDALAAVAAPARGAS